MAVARAACQVWRLSKGVSAGQRHFQWAQLARGAVAAWRQRQHQPLYPHGPVHGHILPLIHRQIPPQLVVALYPEVLYEPSYYESRSNGKR